jgi:hypothetical protein
MKKLTKKQKLYNALNYFHQVFCDLNTFVMNISYTEFKENNISEKTYLKIIKHHESDIKLSNRYYEIMSNILEKIEK